MKLKILLLLLTVGLIYQNCADAQFSTATLGVSGSGQPAAGSPSVSPPQDGTNPLDPGLSGGHFDLDTSHLVYQPSMGTTDHHVHEYDDQYKTTQVDFFNLMDPKFTALSKVIDSNQEFVITVANAELSPAAYLEINGNLIAVTDYQKEVDRFLAGQSLPRYTLNQLTSFKLKFNRDALLIGGLVPTQTRCVQFNELTADGKYRNGALTIQIHDASRVKLDPNTRVATVDGGLLWEATVFWHKENTPCL